MPSGLNSIEACSVDLHLKAKTSKRCLTALYFNSLAVSPSICGTEHAFDPRFYRCAPALEPDLTVSETYNAKCMYASASPSIILPLNPVKRENKAADVVSAS